MIIHRNTKGFQFDALVINHTIKHLDQFSSREPYTSRILYKFCYKLYVKVFKQPFFDINIHLENIEASWLPYAKFNCLIPNQEWFRDETQNYMEQIDAVLCKTKHAEQLFRNAGYSTQYIGFTSPDRLIPHITKNFTAFLHVAGKSPYKGSQKLLDVWMKHPEWPTLHLVWQNVPPEVNINLYKNIIFYDKFLEQSKLDWLMNYCGVHIRPTEMEGFGHAIVEGMSTGAVMLVTDGEPMNEIINSTRGVLINTIESESHTLGIRYIVDRDDLELKIEHIIKMSDNEKKLLGNNARNWYIENNKKFQDSLENILHQILDKEK